MPNWKKLIVSGANASLDHLNVSAITASGNIIPNVDNTLTLGTAANRFQLNGGTPVTVTGSGTTNYLARWSNATELQDSSIFSSNTVTSIQHSNSGNTIFRVSGSNGEILNVEDEVSTEIFRVNDSSGLEIFTVSGSGELKAPNLPYESTSFVLSYASGSGNIKFVSASAVAFDYNSLTNVPNGIVSQSTQLDGFVSQSGNFVANETIIATGTNSVTSSNILALDTTNNYLGINQSNPEVTLHMTGEGAQTAQIRMEQHNNSGDAPDIRTRRTRGTADSPTAVNAGDFIYRQNHEYYTGTEYRTIGQLAVDTNSTNADRFQLTLAVSEDGAAVDAADSQFKIDGNDGGAITFNNSYKFPTSDGTNGQALITNGSGVLSFGDVTSDYTELTNIPNGIVSSSAQLSVFSGSFSGSFVGDGSGLTGLTTTITEETTVSDTFTNQTSVTTSHSFGTKNVLVTVYDDNDAMIIPDSIVTTDSNTVTTTFDSSTSGRVVVGKAGHIVSGSIQSYRENISGASSYTITHNLGEDYPIVQVYNENRSQVIPGEITTTSGNALDLSFDNTFTGVVVVKK